MRESFWESSAETPKIQALVLWRLLVMCRYSANWVSDLQNILAAKVFYRILRLWQYFQNSFTMSFWKQLILTKILFYLQVTRVARCQMFHYQNLVQTFLLILQTGRIVKTDLSTTTNREPILHYVAGGQSTCPQTMALGAEALCWCKIDILLRSIPHNMLQNTMGR